MDFFQSLFGPVAVRSEPDSEVKRRYDQEIAVVHAALVELGISVPGDVADAKAIIKLNRLCSRSGKTFEGLLQSLSALCNDAPLLVDRLTPKAKAASAGVFGRHVDLVAPDDDADAPSEGK